MVSNELTCSNAVKLRVLTISPARVSTKLYVELDSGVDFLNFRVDTKATYVTDNLGHRFYARSFDMTHLTSVADGLLQLHASERIRTYFVLSKIDLKANVFQLYWPDCGVVDFGVQTPLVLEH